VSSPRNSVSKKNSYELKMTTYIAFLRGINVGNIRIKMPDLKQTFENLGFTEVRTYLQTGNVVFSSDKNQAEIKGLLEIKLSERFNYEAFVLLYEHALLTEMIANYSLTSEEGFHDYVIFVGNLTVFGDLKKQIPLIGEESDKVAFNDTYQVVYWKVKIGQSLDTPFAKIIAKAKYKSATTTRNINTLEKMV
jgi:uncharacterized protein (DUF1697 family)